MTIASALQAEVDQEALATRRLLEQLPEDKLTWRPHPKSFTLGQLALHIAQSPAEVALGAVPDTMEAPSFQQAQPASVAEILAAFDAGQKQIRQVLAGLDDARITGTWAMTRQGTTLFSMPRVAFLRSIMMNHVYHHRGQLTVYLRLLDRPLPSVYGPSADVNPFA